MNTTNKNSKFYNTQILLKAGAQINAYLRWSSGIVATVKAKIKEETVLHSAIRLAKVGGKKDNAFLLLNLLHYLKLIYYHHHLI